mgnify:FL=1
MRIFRTVCGMLLVVASIIMSSAITSCSKSVDALRVDALNTAAYSYHYRNLDSTQIYASAALSLAEGYNDGEAEALNNLAFVCIARMDYVQAKTMLDKVFRVTDNQIERLVANIQLMRLCQRRSDNKDFYHYRQRAISCMRRLREDNSMLSPRQRKRMVYAESEYSIVLSSYLYYVGQHRKSAEAIDEIDPSGQVVKDTAQLLAYYYNVGSGGILSAQSHFELIQSEFDYLMRCYLLSRQYHYAFWEANSMQALSEHIQNRADREFLMGSNVQEFDFLNVDMMPDSLLAGNLAQRALGLFDKYGDIYQIAGAWRTLSESFRAIGDNQSALVCLNNALTNDTIINAAPDLVASIREQLSIVYSAMDCKSESDYNRNIYLDLQERTRQDRQLEARVEQLDNSLRQLDVMIGLVLLAIVVVVILLVYFGYMRHKHNNGYSVDILRQPLDLLKKQFSEEERIFNEEKEEMEETVVVQSNRLSRYRERNIEQRAKVLLASSVLPLINRMAHEVKCLLKMSAVSDADECEARFVYISQITDAIENANRQLTHWIQLRQGDFCLNIESFPVQRLFDTIHGSSSNFRMKGVNLEVIATDAVVKADFTLTLFMLNTLTGNARRFTPDGGLVSVFATTTSEYVEISVADTGNGLSKEQAREVFLRRVVNDSKDTSKEGGHGYGLINCKGIIEKYRKLSSFFNVCTIGVESNEGKGSRFYFRLPLGMMRCLAFVIVTLASVIKLVASPAYTADDKVRQLYSRAGIYADSAYFSNVKGDYVRTLMFADSCINVVNEVYHSTKGNNNGEFLLMCLDGDYAATAAELEWFSRGDTVDYSVILDVRNEAAVAALALHRWSLYAYNNAVYTQLFRECSADNSLSSYVRSMQRAESNRNVAIIVLVVLFVGIFPAYYFLYYRHRMSYYRYIDNINAANKVIGNKTIDSVEKLAQIHKIWAFKDNRNGSCPEILQKLYDEMCECLEADVKNARQRQRDVELLHDENTHLSLDGDRYYVVNNVLDNCLSSLKHETMYYPSRLKQLVMNGYNADNVAMLDQLVDYYRLLYTTLISQAANIIGNNMVTFTGIRDEFDYLFVLLKKKNTGKKLQLDIDSKNNEYILISVSLPGYKGGDTRLFSTSTPDVDFLVCCQIMRDFGEFTGSRASGIFARNVSGKLVVELKMPRAIWDMEDCGKRFVDKNRDNVNVVNSQ